MNSGYYRFLQGSLLGMTISLLMIGTASSLYPQAPPETADQVRIQELERSVGTMSGFEARIVRLEDSVLAIREDEAEAKIWYRAIGGALILAVMERILRSTGVLKPKGDGMGPVG